MAVELQDVKQKLWERKCELAGILLDELWRNDEVRDLINEKATGELENILDRWVDVDEYIRLCDTGKLDGCLVVIS
ncbi:hypothetical protein [Neomoorella thermoacetica]|uniref:hypothetical protein n=1 Tax=Neomoorella thermoacetica TaxID=1525 RepID=UPI0008FB2605|nr:hypothetical protein [Moorella thermoacetica]APC08276.1 hypothetical protein MTJW_11100 [Moorella thermoacetica]